MVFCTALLLLIMVTIHAVLPDVTDALPHHLEKSRPSPRSSSSSSSTRSRTRSSELEDWDSGQSSPNLFSNVLLSYDKVKDQEEEEASNKGDDLKSWLSRKFQQLVVASRAAVEKDEDQEAVESDLELAVPRSPNSNEIYLPIDFNLLMPKPDNSSSSTLDANDDLMTNFVDPEESTSEHLFSETAQALIYLAASVEDDRRTEKHAFNFGKQQNKNNLKDSFSLQNLRNDGTFEYLTRPVITTSATTSTTTTTRPTTQRTPVATVSSIINSGRSAYSSTSSASSSSTTPSSKSTSTTTLDSRNISPSYDLPERRFLMTYPVRRLLMAYFAPRILRFQMAMLLNSVIGEVSRKIIDPFIGSRFGIKTAASSSNSAATAPSSASLSSSSPSPSSSPLSLMQLAQTLSSPLSSISSLAGIAQQLSGGGSGGGNAAPTLPVPAAAAAPLAASPAASSSSLNALLSSALSGGGGGGGGGISQATINSLLGQLTDSDMKQMLAMAGLGGGGGAGGQQSQPEVGGLGGGMVAAGSAPPVGHLVPSNVDYDEDPSEEETYTDDSADLMPT